MTKDEKKIDNNKNKKDAVLFITGEEKKKREIVHVPSSWDNADREYGWSRDDYSRAVSSLQRSAGTVSYLEVRIKMLLLETLKMKEIAERPELGGYYDFDPIIHVVEGRVFDSAKYGIFDTVSGERILSPAYLETRSPLCFGFKDGYVYFVIRHGGVEEKPKYSRMSETGKLHRHSETLVEHPASYDVRVSYRSSLKKPYIVNCGGIECCVTNLKGGAEIRCETRDIVRRFENTQIGYAVGVDSALFDKSVKKPE